MNPTLAGYFNALIDAFGTPEPDLTSRQVAALICVGMQRGLSTGEIAARIHAPKAAASRAIDALVRHGLVLRRKRDGDLRLRSVCITKRGREFLERTAARLERIAA